MLRHKPYALRAALLFVSFLFGAVPAFAQKTTNPSLPSVNLGLAVPKVGVGLNVATSSVVMPRTIVGVPAALPVPMVTTVVAPPIASAPSLSAAVGGQGGGVGAALSVSVPSVSGLTPPLDTNLNVNTGGSGPVLAVEVGVSGATVQLGVSGTPPAQDVHVHELMAAAQAGGLASERRLDLVPTCR